MRYFVDSVDCGDTWHVVDGYGGGYLKQAYANQYMCQTECDRLNAIQEGKEAKEILICPACGEETDESGYALVGCNYSTVLCEVCGSSPCDQSC